MAAYLEDNPPPWLALRKLLDEMRDTDRDMELFNFEFSDPQEDVSPFPNTITIPFRRSYRIGQLVKATQSGTFLQERKF